MTDRVPLTPLDAVFLHVESERTPMHIASVGIFEGGPLYGADGTLRIDDVRRLIASRLDLVPKLRQRPAKGLLGEAPLVWLDDPDFEIAQHVRVCRLAPLGTEIELCHLCDPSWRSHWSRRDRSGNLRSLRVSPPARSGLIEKLHHSMADGLAATELATVLLDLSSVPPQGEQVRPWRPDAPRPSRRAAVDDLVHLAALPVRAAKWYGQSILHPILRTRETPWQLPSVRSLRRRSLRPVLL